MYKLMQKRGRDVSKLDKVMQLIVLEVPLPLSYKDHSLQGNRKGYRDCHIEPDWLLIYKIEGNTVIFTETGTHADIFG
jgi:mRNA interferase YafQ